MAKQINAVGFDDDTNADRPVDRRGVMRYVTTPLEAPYDVTTKDFDGGRDAAPLELYDNAFGRFVMGQEPRPQHTSLEQLRIDLNAAKDQVEYAMTAMRSVEKRIIAIEAAEHGRIKNRS